MSTHPYFVVRLGALQPVPPGPFRTAGIAVWIAICGCAARIARNGQNPSSEESKNAERVEKAECAIPITLPADHVQTTFAFHGALVCDVRRCCTRAPPFDLYSTACVGYADMHKKENTKRNVIESVVENLTSDFLG